MSNIKQLKQGDVNIFPISSTRAVLLDDINTTLHEKLSNIDSQLGKADYVSMSNITGITSLVGIVSRTQYASLGETQIKVQGDSIYGNVVGRLEGYETSTIRGGASLSLKPQYFNKFANFTTTETTLILNPGNVSNRVYEYLCEIENNKTTPITLTLPEGIKFAEGIETVNDTEIIIPAGKIIQISIFGSIATAIISQ